MEGVVDREYPHGVVFGYGQNDEAVFQPNIIPSQPQYFPSPHTRGQSDHDNIPEGMGRGRAAGQQLMDFFEG